MGWFLVGWGGLNVPLVTLHANIKLLKLDFHTKFHPNRTKISKVCYWGGFGVGGWGGQNVPPAIPYADILLLTLNYTAPPSFIQIGPKLPYSGWFWGGGEGGSGWLNMGWTLYVFLFGQRPQSVDVL